MKLTSLHRLILGEAANGALTYVDSVRLGATGRTLSCLTDRGFLIPTGRGARRWRLTDAGRKILEEKP